MVEVKTKKTGGLAGVVAGDSAICLCGIGEHGEHTLRYRGYAIEDLTTHATFEEVAWLLTRGKLPRKQELQIYCQQLKKHRDLPISVKEILERIPPDANPMDVLRTGCSALGHYEPETSDHNPIAICDRLLGCMSSMLLYWQKFQSTQKRILLNTDEESVAGHILHLIHGKAPTAIQKHALDMALILYAEHEFNASTFTVRMIASTLSEFYSAVCGGLGSLRGSLHGGANEAAMDLIAQCRDPSDAETIVKQMLARKQLVMGFGHRVYTIADPRSAFVKAYAHKLSLQSKDRDLFEIARRIEEVMWSEKRLFPNLDFYSGLVFHFLGIPNPLFTPIFAFSRITGWTAHFVEQREHNKLIRPISRYVGPSFQAWVPIEQRK